MKMRVQLKIAYNYFDDFCKLPVETRELYLRKSENGNHGYVQASHMQACLFFFHHATSSHIHSQPNQENFEGGKRELRHTFNICTLDAILPDDPLPGFKTHISELAREFKKITSLLLQALAIGLELPLNFFIEKHSHMLDTDNETTFR
jgi:isopenicillin N synthase-like dioxygenase